MRSQSTEPLSPQTAERRKHRRHFIDLPVDCCVIDNRTKGPILAGVAENAGPGGLSIYLNERFSRGRHLIIELYYRDGYKFSSLRLLTRVVWSSELREASGFKHGLKLLKLENGGCTKLQSLLKNSPMLI